MALEDLIRVQLYENEPPTLHGPTDPTPGQTWRIQALRGFIELAVAEIQAAGRAQGSFAIQLEDEAPLEPCFRIDAGWDEPVELTPMIPDPYVLATQAFAGIRAGLSGCPLGGTAWPSLYGGDPAPELPALTPTAAPSAAVQTLPAERQGSRLARCWNHRRGASPEPCCQPPGSPPTCRSTGC